MLLAYHGMELIILHCDLSFLAYRGVNNWQRRIWILVGDFRQQKEMAIMTKPPTDLKVEEENIWQTRNRFMREVGWLMSYYSNVFVLAVTWDIIVKLMFVKFMFVN